MCEIPLLSEDKTFKPKRDFFVVHGSKVEYALQKSEWLIILIDDTFYFVFGFFDGNTFGDINTGFTDYLRPRSG